MQLLHQYILYAVLKTPRSWYLNGLRLNNFIKIDRYMLCLSLSLRRSDLNSPNIVALKLMQRLLIYVFASKFYVIYCNICLAIFAMSLKQFI